MSRKMTAKSVASTNVKSSAGRHQEVVRTGPTYQLAEFVNANWDRVGLTNQQVADDLGYRSPNLISMWRTGKTRIPLERIPDLARLLKVDMTKLLLMWLEQTAGEEPEKLADVVRVFKRLATVNEFNVLRALRTAKGDPEFSESQLEAFRQIAAGDSFATLCLDEARKQGILKEIVEDDAAA